MGKHEVEGRASAEDARRSIDKLTTLVPSCAHLFSLRLSPYNEFPPVMS